MWKVAWRNLWRNKTRTIISITAIALSYAALLVSLGFAEAMYGSMEEAAVETAGGNILVHQDGYWKSQSSESVIPLPQPVLDTIETVEGVESIIQRVLVMGLISSARGSAAVRLSGIDPRDETHLLDLAPFVIEGSFLGGDSNDPIVLGIDLVEDLEVQMGDRIVLTATRPDGEVARALFHLTGILDTGMQVIDEMSAYTTVEGAQQAFQMGSALTQIGILIDRDPERHHIRDQIRDRLGALAADLELLTWDEALPELVGYIEIDRSFGVLYGIIALIIVGFGIANTFLMSVMERIREFGLLGAIGLTPRRTLRLVFLEALCLGLSSVVIGFVIGAAIHYYLATVGINLAAFGDFDWEISGVALAYTVVHSRFNPLTWFIATVMVLLLVLVTAIYPAWRAKRLQPAQAMRTFQ